MCYINARSLAKESRLLKENGYHARALSLAILALEELGKIPLICNMILCRKDDAEAWRKAWKEFQSHRFKLGVWTVYGKRLLNMLGKGHESEFPSGIEPLADKFKQLGFYTSFFKGEFILPEEFAKDNPEWLNYFLELLEERIARFEPLHGSLESSESFTERGIDLLATVEKAKSTDELKKILSAWISQQVKAV